MTFNPLRNAWLSGEYTVNGWLSMPSPVSGEAMAQGGWDSLTADLQHGMVDYQAAVGLMQVAATRGVPVMARVPWNEPGVIMKMLDAGALSVICPMVNTREEAEALVRACRYAPMGERSFGPLRASWRYGADYAAQANEEVLVLPMIETPTAVHNLEDIMTTPGVDGVYIGPADLGLGHGFAPKTDREEPELLAIIDQIVEVAKTHGKFTGIHCGAPAYAKRMFAKGFDFVTILSDAALLVNAAKQAVVETKSGESEQSSSPY